MPSFLDSPGDWAAIVTIVVALMAGLLWLVRGEIQKATRQIQPKANGGLSLTDLHAKTDLVFARQSDLADDVKDIRTELKDGLATAQQRLDSHLSGQHNRRTTDPKE